MSPQIPPVDERTYEDLVKEALARIPVHTPEYTNFRNESDPGRTLIEVFAFFTENLLYRSNQIPERNRRKFLSLLGVPVRPASSARGIITLSNERGPLQTLTLAGGLEVRAGQVPYHTDQGLDVLPVDGRVFYKRIVKNPGQQTLDYYNQLYASYLMPPLSTTSLLYETTPLGSGVNAAAEAVDGSLWVALAARKGDDIEEARRQIGGKVLSLGVVPSLGDGGRRLSPGGRTTTAEQTIKYDMPVGGTLPAAEADRQPRYRPLDAAQSVDVLSVPGVVQITLPPAPELRLWDNLDPLEAGVKEFPPALEDTDLNSRILTWIRIKPSSSARAQFRWVGTNAVMITQRAHVANELLPSGTGAPDQTVVLSRTPVIPGTVRLTIGTKAWEEIDDIMSADPEVTLSSQRQSYDVEAATADRKEVRVNVFQLDPVSGTVRFGDGTRGARPAGGAAIRASYDYGLGIRGNVNENAINSGPTLPAGIMVSNPVRTWGGAEAATASEGEKQISGYLQHRDRLVTAGDFDAVVRRTPGVDIGRVEVIPAFNPDLSPNEPGDAPGAVTLMIIPKYDPARPDAPLPNKIFIDTVCEYIDPKRLVTTEVFLLGPSYKSVWISAGISVVTGHSIAEVREAVKRRLLRFLSPLPYAEPENPGTPECPVAATYAHMQTGWPLYKSVAALELATEAGRAAGVASIKKLLLGDEKGNNKDLVEMQGLELPRVIGISVAIGEPLDLDQLRGQAAPAPEPGAPSAVVPVPVVPEECR
jgi:hypothetical protein